jgi:DNA repair exonuclease SbcCD nuclease subunit
VQFATNTEYLNVIPYENLNNIRLFLKKKISKLSSLKLYDCDESTLDLVTRDAETLEELQIVKFKKQNLFKELLGLKKLKNLEKLSLCSTWFPLEIKKPEEGEQEVEGQRELEQIIFALKGSLTNLHMGNYIWDDLVIYIAEMCKELEVVQFFSTQITDACISHLLKRAEHLTALDVAGCSEFTGLALADFEDLETFKCKKLRWF